MKLSEVPCSAAMLASVRDKLQIVQALEVLEFHDRNYLSHTMAQPGLCSREKQRLLADAEAALSAAKGC